MKMSLILQALVPFNDLCSGCVCETAFVSRLSLFVHLADCHINGMEQ